MPPSPTETETANGNGNGTKHNNASDKEDWAFNKRAEAERVVGKEWKELPSKKKKSLDRAGWERAGWEQRAKARVAG